MSFVAREKQSTSAYVNALLKHCARHIQVRLSNFTHTPRIILTIPVAKIDAVQAEYSAFETLHETTGLIETAKELGIPFVAFSPLGHGWLVDDFQYKSPDDFAPDDFRRTGKSHHSHLWNGDLSSDELTYSSSKIPRRKLLQEQGYCRRD